MCVLLHSICFEFFLTGYSGMTTVICFSLFLKICMCLWSGGLVRVHRVQNHHWLFGNSHVTTAVNLRAAVTAGPIPMLQLGALMWFLFLLLCPHVKGLLLRTQSATTQHLWRFGGSLKRVIRRVDFFTAQVFPSWRTWLWSPFLVRLWQSTSNELASPGAFQSPWHPRGCGRPCFGPLCFFTLYSLDLQPLELDKSINILAQKPSYARHSSGSALCVQKHSHVPQVPGVKRGWEEVWIIVFRLCLALTWVEIEVNWIDFFSSKIKIWRCEGRRRNGNSFWIREITCTVLISIFFNNFHWLKVKKQPVPWGPLSPGTERTPFWFSFRGNAFLKLMLSWFGDTYEAAFQLGRNVRDLGFTTPFSWRILWMLYFIPRWTSIHIAAFLMRFIHPIPFLEKITWLTII